MTHQRQESMLHRIPSAAAAAAAAALVVRRGRARLLAAAIRQPFSSSDSSGSSGSRDDEEERRPHVWGDIPTGPGGHMSTAVGGGGRQFFVSYVGDEDQQHHEEGREPVDFLAESSLFLDRVEKGLADMKAVNDPFDVARDETELTVDLGPAKGRFTLQRDWTQNQLVLLSPVSGIHKYQCHVSGGGKEAAPARWLSVTGDRHDLVGMLTRDLIRVCAGCPQI